MDAQTEHILAIARKHFPYPTPNPGQLETIVETVKAFKSGKKHVVVQAPTGIGKSAIAKTVHSVMAELSPDRFRTTITTASKALQDQYTEEYKQIYDLRGRTNYDCPHSLGPYNSGSCRGARRRKECNAKAECPYLQTRNHWCNIADLRVTNNSFSIEACAMLVMRPENRANLIIIDECHEIDDSLLEHTKIMLRPSDFWGIDDLSEQIKKVISLFTMIPLGVPVVTTDNMKQAFAEFAERASAVYDRLVEDFEKRNGDLDALGDKIDTMETIMDKLGMFIGPEVSTWIVEEVNPDLSYLSLKPIKASQVAYYGLFRKADYFLHMSATICGFGEYAESLGIKDDEVEYLDAPNPIPVASRMVYVPAKQKVSGTIDYDQLTENIDNLISLHPEENGLIHTVSYMLANEVFKRSKHRDRMFMSKDRAEMVSELRTRKNVVVLSPSIEKGFDAKGDMARFQIVAKVPFPYLGDSLVKYNSTNTAGWYERKTALRVVQACGRVTRGVSDFGVTYIIDTNFRRLYEQNPHLFPEWYKQSVRM
ncbi:conserved hypothetical protein [Delftia phage PhiW-14]|uniref:Helicase ATP-binding domain-containing protein n=1 Tax=Delftia phage PhiW-14 TaxID=665032 RepID=C9DG41_BPW14|nr:DNA helicase [Delftia phage PhiW-14]ACV50092.1 conserved hypothetical protein [Delftia phage PhiW-14]